MQGLNLLADAAVPFAPRPRAHVAGGVRKRRAAYKRRPLSENQRFACFVAAVRAAGSEPLSTNPRHAVIQKAHTLLKAGGVLEGVGPSRDLLKAANAAATIRYWVQRFLSGATVSVKLLRKARKLKYSISEAEIKACIAEVTQRKCPSMAAAGEMCESIKGVLRASGCSLRYLWEKLCAYDPEFKQHSLHFKRTLKPAQLRKRVLYAFAMLRAALSGVQAIRCIAAGLPGLKYSDLIVWIDQKLMYVSPGATIRVWGSSRACLAAEDQPSYTESVPDLRKGGISYRIYYYSAVNALTGAVAIVMCTGSVGPGVPPTPYKVRTTL